MNQIESLLASVETELQAYRSVLNEYEETLDEVEQRLEESKLEDDTEIDQVSIDPNVPGGPEPAGAG